MTVNDLIRILSLTVYHLEDGTLPLRGVYCGDVLSRVMGRASQGDLWLTTLDNSNAAAAAGLVGLSAVILTEGVRPCEKLRDRAALHQINLLGCPEDTWLTALRLHAVLEHQ